jgi:hypothetical protein
MRRLVWAMDRAKLELTTNQYVQIEKIMQDTQATNAAIRIKFAPQLQAEKERAQKAITQVLAPEQRPVLADLLNKPEPRLDGRGRRSGEGGGFQMRNTNRFPTNGFPDEPRGRMGRRGPNNNPSTNGPPTNSPSTNGLPAINSSTNGRAANNNASEGNALNQLL